MKDLRFYIFLFMLGVLAIACRDDFTELTETETGTHEPIVFVSTSFNGFVFDEAGEALESVRITMNNTNAYTDSRGFFQISGKVNSTGAYISAHLDDYYEGHGNVIPSADNTGHVRFTLKARTAKGVIDSNSEAKVSLENGSEISFRTNSFVDEDGNAYQGKVTVYADYLDPSVSNFESVMPGDLLAISNEDGAVILQSFGMLNVELESESGEQIQINQDAVIKVKVPDANLNTAQDEIPLWYFDTSDGLWKEEGSAVLDNGYYVGEVAHFTLWNCDVPYPLVVLSGNLIVRGSIPYAKIKVTWIETGVMNTTYTDSEGNFSGKVPANALLLIEVLDGCEEVIYSEEIGPLTEDTFVNLVSPPSDNNSLTISGNLVCNGEMVTNGYVLIQLEGETDYHIAIVDEGGNFATEVLNCDSENITIIGIDIESGEEGNPEVFPIDTEISIEDLFACGSEIEYKAVFTFNDQEYTIKIIDTPITISNGGYLINIIEKLETHISSVGYSFVRSAQHNDNWIQFLGYSTPLDDDHLVYRASVQDDFVGMPGSIEILETSEYVEIYIPNANIFTYADQTPNYVAYEGTFFLRAKK